jgi:hypothetical protein
MNAADMTFQVLAAIETLATAINGASKSACALANPGSGNSGGLGRDSTSPTLLGQIRDWHGGSVAARSGHPNVATARNLNVKVDMRRRADRSYASSVIRKRLRRNDRGKSELDGSGGVRQGAVRGRRLGILHVKIRVENTRAYEARLTSSTLESLSSSSCRLFKTPRGCCQMLLE